MNATLLSALPLPLVSMGLDETREDIFAVRARLPTQQSVLLEPVLYPAQMRFTLLMKNKQMSELHIHYIHRSAATASVTQFYS